jgi:hypothetical protein
VVGQARAPGALGLGTGLPLPAPERSYFERRLGADLSGWPLDSSIRDSMEEQFGRSFGDVRIHTDETAASAASNLGTKAFTRDQDIFFGHGNFQPGTREGNRLLAHELTHTVQQRNGPQTIQTDTQADPCAAPSTGDTLEIEAAAIAQQVTSGDKAGPISAATPGTIQRDPPSGNQPPDPGTAITPAPALTLDNLIRATPPGFVDPTLDRAYQAYRTKETHPADPRTWALRVTVGAPRARLELLLGEDYAVGQRSGAARPPVNVLDTTRPPNLTDAQLEQQLQTLGQNLPAFRDRLTPVVQTPIPGGMMSSGTYANLQGIIGEALARPVLESALEEIRKTIPDAQLFMNVRARLLERDASGVLKPGSQVQFSDGVIAAVRGGKLWIFRIAEVKSGEGGGVQAAEQVFRWIEAHATVGFIIDVPGAGSFEHSEVHQDAVNLTRATRLVIVPQGSLLPGLRSGHGTTAPKQLVEIAPADQIQFLTRMVARYIIQFQAAQAAMRQALTHKVEPYEVSSVDQFRDPAVRKKILDSGGYARVTGRIYRISLSGENLQVRMLAPAPIIPQLPGGAGSPLALPPGGSTAANPASPEAPPALAPPQAPMLPQPSATQGTPTAPAAPQGTPAPQLPSSAGAPVSETAPLTGAGAMTVSPVALMESITGESASEGGLEIMTAAIQFQLTPTGLVPLEPGAPGGAIFFVADKATGKVAAGIFEGDVWFGVTEAGKFTPLTPEMAELAGGEQLTFDQVMELIASSKPGEEEGPMGGGASGGAKAVVGAANAIMAIESILESYNMAVNQQRKNIAQQQAAINFWTVYGANPTSGMWNATDYSWSNAYGKAVSLDTDPDTNAFGGETTPYIVDLDISAFKSTLPRLIHNYREFLMFIDAAREIGAMTEDPIMPSSPTKEEAAAPRRYTVTVNWRDRNNKKVYDITDAIDQVRTQTLASLEAEMTGKLAALSPEARQNIKRLKNGSATPLYRSTGSGFFSFHSAIRIMSAPIVLGPDPWVRPVGPHQYGKTLVVAANADAERASLVSSYLIYNDIESVLKEVQDGGRKILDQTKDGDYLASFVAGPDPDGARFGETRYYRQPGEPRFTVGIGELKQFWVDDGDLEPLDAKTVDAKVAPPPAK